MIHKNKDQQQETTSSSSETSGSLSRKSKSTYLSRKPGKSMQNLTKRHVRSSSGYSSHNEETTFRLVHFWILEFSLHFNDTIIFVHIFRLAYRIIRITNHICHHRLVFLTQPVIKNQRAAHHEFEPIQSCIEKHSKLMCEITLLLIIHSIINTCIWQHSINLWVCINRQIIRKHRIN